MQRLYRKRIVLGVGGGIAAYKVPNWSAACVTMAPRSGW